MSEYYIGIMSGTSMDDIDAVLVDLDDNARVIQQTTLAFPSDLHQEITQLITTPEISLSKLGYLNIAITELYVQLVDKLLALAHLDASKITAIGCHGQTVFHQPEGEHRFSLQLISGSYLAEKTHITSITDFRNRDMAAGGQGAPLVPAFHKELFKDQQHSRLVINLGGIANCTWLPTYGEVNGFDIGPGNTLMDCWIKACRGLSYDKKGDWAKTGKVNAQLLESLLSDDYFQRSAPKSTGREYFNLKWLHQSAEQNIKELKPEDVQATLLQLTACSIADTINQYKPDQSYFCGGGAHNTELISKIKGLTSTDIIDINELGIEPDLVEAAAFAWLARRCLELKDGTLASVTGAKHSVIAGAVYFA